MVHDGVSWYGPSKTVCSQPGCMRQWDAMQAQAKAARPRKRAPWEIEQLRRTERNERRRRRRKGRAA
jgi:hypothetical protein